MDFTSRLKVYQTSCKKEDEESMCWNKNTWEFSCNFVIVPLSFFHLTFVIFNFSVPNCHLSSSKNYLSFLLKECGFGRSPLTKRQSARFVLKTVFSIFPEHKF